MSVTPLIAQSFAEGNQKHHPLQWNFFVMAEKEFKALACKRLSHVPFLQVQ
jgi:hypothetical protein